MSHNMVHATLNGQFEIVIPEHRAKREAWYTAQGWEKARLNSMHEHIGKGDVVFYVGSEEAEFPALLTIWGADVVMFEPNPLVWPNALAIWQANGLKAPRGIYVGFASSVTDDNPPNRAPGAEGMVTPGDWPQSAYGEVIGNHGFKELYQEADAFPQIRIDDYVERTGIVPTAISFDCEGSGFEVMKGAERTLLEHRPKIWASWHPEFKFHQYGVYLSEARGWVRDKDYDEQLLAYDHEVHMLYTPREVR